MKRSPLHERHLALDARMVEFAGWRMPIQYAGIAAEHRAVREKAGVFDISHMGEFEVRGAGACDWLNSMLTNDCSVLEKGEGQYTILLNEKGGVIDDLIAYRVDEERFFLVVNAAKIQEDREWLRAHGAADAELLDRSDEFGALAVQGPESARLWNEIAPGHPLPPRNGIRVGEDGSILCRTGYTGEDGFELFAPSDAIGEWFDRLLAAGAAPCGLGARDTLRLEKCYPLNGSDLNPERTPLEAGLGFCVKLDKTGGFVGDEALRAQKAAGPASRLRAIVLTGKAPPLRQGYEVLDEEGETVLGTLASGTLSPSLGKGIGMAYLPASSTPPGTPLSVSIRGKIYPAEVVKKPFL
ncbi:MAG: glycine cleavage system aminomethyltransferase GcvT [Verrucomicrobiales bacterium]